MSNAHRLLVVDDDPDLRDTLAEQLALYDEFEILSADTAASAVNQAKGDRIDLAIMDVGLPDMDGREAVKIMRRNGFRSPIIMLTAQVSDADTVLGLEAGANDYVVKPFKFAVLLARIRAQLRQYEASEDAVFQIGPYTFRPGAKLLVSEKGSKLKLTEKETAILRFLYRAGQKVVGRDVLLAEVWGYNANVTTHTLETHIYRLRQKIEFEPLPRAHPGDRAGRLQAVALKGPPRWRSRTTSRRCPARRCSASWTTTRCASSPSPASTGRCGRATCCSGKGIPPTAASS